MKTIVIFSGKGGVGKTNFVAALSLVASRKNKIIVSDCDVDTPNLYLMLGLKKVMHKKSIWGREKPYFAKKCGEKFKEKVKVCPFDAIYWDKKSKELKINKFLCEGCGLCMHFFPKGYIRLKREKIGKKVVGLTNFGFKIVYGDLEIGERESGLIVSEIRETARDVGERDSSEFLIVDSASGIGCPVIASIKNADLLVIIFEPTLMSFEYGKRAIELGNFFGSKMSAVINKSGINEKIEKKIEEFLRKRKIPVIGKIPFDKKFLEATTLGKPIPLIEEKYEKLFENIWERITYRLRR